MKKRCQIIITIIILASFFISCGIPNYFYLEDDDDYNFTSANNEDKTEITATLQINDTVELDKLDKLDDGISMVYFYFLSALDTISTDTFEDEFKDKFIGSTGIGTIGGPSNITKDSVIGYIGDDDEPYDLYAFNFKEDDLVSPYYHDLIELQNDEITSDEITSDEKIIYADFSFTLKQDSGSYIVTYQRDNDDDDEFVTDDFQLDLYRFNRGNFLSSDSSLSESDLKSDYSQFSVTQPGSYYIHIFAAFTAQQGDFTNRWWSSLEYLGCLKIT